MSSDLDLRIESLRVEITDAAGHEHRIPPIARRAAELLAERLEQQRDSDAGRASTEIESVSARALSLDLGTTTDEQAANDIAAAWLDALAVHLEA
jgi:hypothetical protein